MKTKTFFVSLAALCACACSNTIDVYVSDPSLESEVKVWKEMISRHDSAVPGTTTLGYERKVSEAEFPDIRLTGKESKADLVLSIDPGQPEEGFSISGGRVSGGSAAGVFHALQYITLETLAGGDLKSLDLTTAPKYAHRGALLDCCRHFFSVDEVKSFIDILALNNMNVFHWHLTEDQGWRIEIKKYPLLTEIGSVRDSTSERRYNEHWDKSRNSKPYGPFFYTQDQIRGIVAYASARHIEIIPEIDMPGHMVAALASYPWLGCVGEGYRVRTKWGISKDVLCLGKESTYQFLKDVLDEVLELFPGRSIHLGGDEAPRIRWESCPECQAFMKKHGMKKEGELQKYMAKVIGDYVREKGRTAIVWDDSIDGGLDSDAVVMNWSMREGRFEKVLGNGNRIIQTPKRYCYLDYYQTYEPLKNGELDGGARRYVPLQRCVEFNPVEGLSAEDAAKVLGIQGNVWTEHMPGFDQVEFMVLPRLSALAEVGWGSGMDYDSFIEKFRSRLAPAYEFFGWVYAPFAIDGTEPRSASDEFQAKYVKP